MLLDRRPMIDEDTTMTIVNLALVQMTCSGQVQSNIDKATQKVAEAAAKGAHVVCLQEVFSSHYPCQSEDHAHFELAEPIPGPTSKAMSDAAKAHGVVVTGSVFERRTHGLYHNTALVFDTDGEMVGFYRKMHIPDDPSYYEKFYFAPGDTGFTVAKTKYCTLGVGVCWDQWYPEAARLFALRGAEIIVYPTAIGWLAEDKPIYGKSQHEAWDTMMRSHAIANGVFVGAANRVGQETNLEFWGASFAYDPFGNLIQRASHDQEEILIVPCDLGLIDITRTHWPFLRDRRIDFYGDLCKRWIGPDPYEARKLP